MQANSFYRHLRLLLDQVARPRGCRQTFSDADIAFALLWAEHHRRPVSWACRRDSYPPAARLNVPSPTTLSRRGNSHAVLRLIESARQHLVAQVQASPLKLIDSRPLVIGNASADPDARRGRAVREMARGYKLCTIVSGGVVRAWTIDSLNRNDQDLAPSRIGAADAHAEQTVERRLGLRGRRQRFRRQRSVRSGSSTQPPVGRSAACQQPQPA